MFYARTGRWVTQAAEGGRGAQCPGERAVGPIKGLSQELWVGRLAQAFIHSELLSAKRAEREQRGNYLEQLNVTCQTRQ